MQHLDEGAIHSWLDGALSADEAARVEAHVKECPQCASAVAEARGFIAAASRILTALDNAPHGVVPAAAPRRRVDPLVWRVAATVLVVAAGTFVVVRSRGVNERVMSSATDNSRPSQPATSNRAPIPAITAPISAADKSAPKSAVINAPARGRSQPTGAQAGSKLSASEGKSLAAGAARAGQIPPAFEAVGAAAPSAPASQPSRAAGVMSTGAASEQERLKIVDSIRRTGANVTLYEVAPGDTVTLTETIPLLLDQVVVTGVGTSIARQSRGKSAATSKARVDATVGAASDSQSTMRTPLSAPTAAALGREGNHIIKWTDPATGNTLTLTGRLPEARLQEIRIRIERERAAAVKKNP
jgi:Putative zinc-finger